MSDVVIRVKATPASAGTPTFTSGCGSDDGTSACDLGQVDAQSAKTQLRVRVTVPATATAVTAVRLTASANAAKLTCDAKVSVPVSVTTPPAIKQIKAAMKAAKPTPAARTLTARPTADQPTIDQPTTAPALSAGSLLDPPATSSGSSLAPGGSAAGLFPTLNPTQSPAATATPSKDWPSRVLNEGTRPMANTSALPEGASAIGAQLVGLAALGVAFLLVVTRLALRRRPAAKPTAGASGDEEETTDSAG